MKEMAAMVTGPNDERIMEAFTTNLKRVHGFTSSDRKTSSTYWVISASTKDPDLKNKFYKLALSSSWTLVQGIIFGSFDGSQLHLYLRLLRARGLEHVSIARARAGISEAQFRHRIKKIDKATLRGLMRGGCYIEDMRVPLRPVYIEIYPEDKEFLDLEFSGDEGSPRED